MLAKKVLIINGPNLNMLHLRNNAIYGETSLTKIEQDCLSKAEYLKQNQQIDLKVNFFQSNCEGEIVLEIQKAVGKYSALVINAAAYTHTSIAIRDALEIFSGPKIELHLSNIAKREEFRHQSFVSAVVDGVIFGFGQQGYILALQALATIFNAKK